MLCVILIGIHSRIMYNEMNEKIERISKLVYSIFVEASIAGLVVPPLLITLVNYFIYDLKEDSYFLPTPVLYAIDTHINMVNQFMTANKNFTSFLFFLIFFM